MVPVGDDEPVWRPSPEGSVRSAYQRASFRLTPSQIAEVARLAQGWKSKAPTIAAMSGQPEMPEGGRA